jgi:hypothetical protein
MKRMKITVTADFDFDPANYEHTEDHDAKAAGIELPIDTIEKAAKMEQWWLDNDKSDIMLFLDGDIKHKIEVVEA